MGHTASNVDGKHIAIGEGVNTFLTDRIVIAAIVQYIAVFALCFTIINKCGGICCYLQLCACTSCHGKCTVSSVNVIVGGICTFVENVRERVRTAAHFGLAAGYCGGDTLITYKV